MTARIALALSTLALLLGVIGGAAAADNGFVPFADNHGDVILTGTYAAPPLTLNTTYAAARNMLVAHNAAGQTITSISADGQIKSGYTSATQSPRLVLSSAGYSGADTIIEEVGSSPVATLSAGGEFESYNYYFCCDQPRFSVRDHSDNIVGGIASGGALITAQHAAPLAKNLANGEARVWYDPTPGTGGLMVTAKDSAGTMTTVKLG